MSDETKYRLYLSVAGVLYVWGLAAMWLAHEWAIPEGLFFFVGILPVIVGVGFMVLAVQTRSHLLAEDDHDDTDASAEQPVSEPSQS